MSLDALRDVLAREGDVLLAVLFGSSATNRRRPTSDIDLGVLLMPGTSIERHLAARLSRVAGRVVDLVRLDEAPPLLRFEIARDGHVLLERSPHAWADFRARAMTDWWDWAPTARLFQRAAVARLRAGVTDGPA